MVLLEPIEIKSTALSKLQTIKTISSYNGEMQFAIYSNEWFYLVVNGSIYSSEWYFCSEYYSSERYLFIVVNGIFAVNIIVVNGIYL